MGAIGSIMQALLGFFSSIFGQIQDAKTNQYNIEAQKDINATNIAAAKEQLEKQLAAAKEDRLYNSASGQNDRLLGIGLSPAAARQAVAGLGAGTSQLGQVNQQLPQQIAPHAEMSQKKMFEGVGLDTANIEQALIQKHMQEAQFAHEDAMHAYDNIYEGWNREDVIKAKEIANPLFTKIERLFQNNGDDMYNMTMMDLRNYLGENDSTLLTELDEVLNNNPAARDVLNMYISKAQSQSSEQANTERVRTEKDLAIVNKRIAELSEEKLKEELKHYPEMCRLALQLKRKELEFNSEQTRQLIVSGEFQRATLQKQLQMLGLECDVKALQKEGLKINNETNKFLRGSDSEYGANGFERAIFGGTYKFGALIGNLGQIIQGIVKIGG